ncbi:MAG: MmgE/PrpD family protein [Chloroflexi bacterium]|nr:MmgE/PrpD family protein [Chloroflexota bacterium]
MGATRELARFVANLEYSGLPTHIADRMKLHLLDGVGCGVFGSTLEHCKQVIKVVEQLGGRPEAGILGTGIRTSAYNAALANGTLVNGYELDDVGVYCHPASTMLPSALAMAEVRGKVDGKTLITALVAGYECAIRVAECTGVRPEHDIGWHTPPFHGTIGSAITAAKVLGFNEEQTFRAIGIAGDIAGGGLYSSRPTASASKRLHAGRGASAGVLSAMLAREGFTGIPDVLEFEPWGYCWALTGYVGEGEKPWDINKITRGLGKDFVALDRIAIKYYPTVGCWIPIADCMRAIKRKREISPDSIEKVLIGIRKAHGHSEVRRPIDDLASTNFSARYSAALSFLYDIPPLPDSPLALDLWPEKYKDPVVLDLMKKIETVVDEELDRRKTYGNDTYVKMYLKDGTLLEHRTEYEKDAPSLGTIRFRTMTPKDIENKFRNVVAKVLSKKTTEYLIESFGNIDSSQDVTPVLRKLKPA